MVTQGVIYVNKAKSKTQIDRLSNLAKSAGTVIYEASSVFPFQLFPDKIVIDKTKVTIVRHGLFYKRLIPIPMKDMLTVKITRGILFAALDFEVKRYENNPAPLTHLWPSEALKAEKYILGLAQAVKNRIDLSQLSAPEILDKIETIGTGGNEGEGMF